MADVRGGETSEHASFRLERFTWAAPDRLEIAGSFDGLRSPPGDPALVLGGPAGLVRLDGEVRSGAQDGSDGWSAAFRWRQPPVPFDTAGLEIGEGRLVALPAPDAGTNGDGPLEIPVRLPESSSEPVAARPRPGADLLRMQAALVAAQDEARQAEAARERVEAELARARQDLEGDRARQAADAERFRAGLAQLQGAAERALAENQDEMSELRRRVAELVAEREQVGGLRAALEQAQEEHAAARTELERVQAEGAAARGEVERVQAESAAARGELEHARAQTLQTREALERATADNAAARAELQRAEDHAAELRAALEAASGEAAAARAELERVTADMATTRSELERARAAENESERLRARLAAVRDALGQEE